MPINNTWRKLHLVPSIKQIKISHKLSTAVLTLQCYLHVTLPPPPSFSCECYVVCTVWTGHGAAPWLRTDDGSSVQDIKLLCPSPLTSRCRDHAVTIQPCTRQPADTQRDTWHSWYTWQSDASDAMYSTILTLLLVAATSSAQDTEDPLEKLIRQDI